jgi:hypothetical protein
MLSSKESYYTWIICPAHNRKEITDAFNDQTKIDKIHQHVRDRLGYCLRNSFYIQFHHPKTKELIKLNQTVLDSVDNPFKLRSSINGTDDENIFDMLELYVVEDSPTNAEVYTRSSIYKFQYT